MKISPPARALLAMAAAHWCVCAQGSFRAAVFNYAGVPHAILAPALEKARMAFLGVRIGSRWVICDPEGCEGRLPAGSYLEIFVMPRLRTPLSGPSLDHAAGYAMPSGFARPRAYAFYDAANEVAQRTARPLDLVLGCILIHEAGHLLGLPHGRSGVMRPELEGADMDSAARGRAFSAEEGRELSKMLNGRTTLRAAFR